MENQPAEVQLSILGDQICEIEEAIEGGRFQGTGVITSYSIHYTKLYDGFLARLTPEDVGAIAEMLFVELLEGGYTGIAEFHYLHHAPDGRPYPARGEMAARILGAAADAGLGITLLPVLYAHGGFGGEPPTPGQARFLNDVDSSDVLAGIREEAAKHQLRGRHREITVV